VPAGQFSNSTFNLRFHAMSSTTTQTMHGSASLVMDRLKAETRGSHDDTEGIPYSAAVVGRRLPKDRFIGQLAAYRTIHGALERAISQSTDPAVTAVWDATMVKAPLLDADLAYFGADETTAPLAARAAAQAFSDRIQDLAESDPVALLGFLYVLEGSTLGATILRGHLAAAYGLENDQGLAYQSPYGASPMPQWMAFKARMNAAISDGPTQDRVVAAAQEAFRRIGDVLRALSVGLEG